MQRVPPIDDESVESGIDAVDAFEVARVLDDVVLFGRLALEFRNR